MWAGFLSIVGIYGLCAVAVHAVYAVHRPKKDSMKTHLILVTHNNQSEIEWYMHSYLFFSWVRGRQSNITVFDDGSSDETPEIISRISRARPYIQFYRDTEELDPFLTSHEHEPVLLIRLDQLDLHSKRPIHQW